MARTIRRGKAPRQSRRKQRGFSVMLALVCVIVMGIYLMEVGEVWSTQVQRTKEEDLLRKGDAIRSAIQAYVKADSSGRYPMNFDDLVRDSRVPLRRFLREAYLDPMTNGPWEIVRGPGGELYGVYTSASGTPLKQNGFSDDDAMFAVQTSYQDWKFTVYPSMSLQRR